MNKEEIWKDVTVILPKTGYQVSNLGRIRKLNIDGDYVIVNQTITKIGYANINIKNHEGNTRHYSVHRLVAGAFIPIDSSIKPNRITDSKDGIPYHVNHKDGNKLNNYYKNLEWCNIKQNSIHARMMGLNSSNVRVRVYDMKTSKIKDYLSLIELSKFLNINTRSIYAIIKNHYINVNGNKHMWDNRYLFEIISLENMNKIKSLRNIEIIVMDYVNNTQTKCDTTSAASFLTGINNCTIINVIHRNKDKAFNKIIAGYSFLATKYLSNQNTKIPWPNVTIERATAIRNNYIKNLHEKRHNNYKEIEVMDILSKTIKIYNNMIEAAKDNSLSHNQIFNYLSLSKQKRLRLVNNKIYRYKGDSRSWDTAVPLQRGVKIV